MTFKVGGREFSDGTHVMGILNATADSFYAASRVTPGEAAERAARMAEEGAEIIDIGAQSTRPGADRVSALEEMSLLLPVLERVRAAVDVPISVDTFYPEVAEAALSVGADMINDVSCLASAGMAERVAEGGASDGGKDSPFRLYIDGYEWGAGVYKIVMDFGGEVGGNLQESLQLTTSSGSRRSEVETVSAYNCDEEGNRADTAQAMTEMFLSL